MKKDNKTPLFNSFSIMVAGIIGIIGISLGSIVYNVFTNSENLSSIDATQKRCENCSVQAGVDIFHDVNNPETEEVWCETHQRFETRIKNDSENR